MQVKIEFMTVSFNKFSKIGFAAVLFSFVWGMLVSAQDNQTQPQAQPQSQAPAQPPVQTKAPDALADWPMIEKEYKALRADRDNILAQVKTAYDDKNKAYEELRALKEKSSSSVVEKEELAKKIEIFDKEKMDLEEKISSFEDNNKELAEQIESLQKLNKTLTEENQEMLNQAGLRESTKVQVPKSLMSAVKDREQMVRENADMHYNLGVLLSKNQEFRNAAIEFQRAIELRKDDASSYFNLGKIYADFYKDKVKAVGYFKKYLELNPQAEDRNWVQNFITSFKSWKAEEKIA